MTLSSELGLHWFEILTKWTFGSEEEDLDSYNSSDSVVISQTASSNSIANSHIVYGVLQLLGTANACSNPILYGYLNENFFNEYKSIYRR